MLVIDASALLDLLLARPQAEEVGRHVADRGPDVHAPELVDLEVVSALRRLVSCGETSATRATQAIDDLLSLPMQRHAHAPLLARVWQLRETMTAHDASYLALAEVVGHSAAPLLTTDARFARAIAATSDVEALLVA